MIVAFNTRRSLSSAFVHNMGTARVKYAAGRRVHQIRRCTGHGVKLGLI